MSFSGAAEDRLAIRELWDTYSDAVFRHDSEAWGATWAEDAQWTLMGQDFKGRAAIVAMWKQAMSAYKLVAFTAQAGALTIEGDRAHGRCYTFETLHGVDGGVRRVIGTYEDTFVKQGGAWRFASRAYSMLEAETVVEGKKA